MKKKSRDETGWIKRSIIKKKCKKKKKKKKKKVSTMDVIPEVHRLESIGVDYTSSGAIHFSFASRNYLLMLLDFAGVE